MKANRVLARIKNAIQETGYVNFSVYDHADNVYDNGESIQYSFNDNSILSFILDSKLYVVSTYK